MERINTIWDTIGRVCVYLLFGLGPLFFLPLTAFPLAQGKIFFVGTVVFVGVATYLARIIATGIISFPKRDIAKFRFECTLALAYKHYFIASGIDIKEIILFGGISQRQ